MDTDKRDDDDALATFCNIRLRIIVPAMTACLSVSIGVHP